MRHRLLRHLAIAALVVSSSVLGTMTAPLPASAALTAPPTWCTGAAGPRLALKGSTAGADGRSTPIVLVHGFAGDSSIWTHTVNRIEVAGEQGAWKDSMQAALQALPGAAVFTYDYGRFSTDWVTQDSIAADLGTDIDCLAKASGGKVIVVAHSMGGLALRAALQIGGAARAAELQEVITLGTPNSGSRIAQIAQQVGDGTPLAGSDADLFGLLSMLRTACPTIPTIGFSCGWWDQLWTGTRTPAAKALASGSAEMAALAPWPSGVHVRALAGDMDVQLSRAVTWFGQGLDTTHNHVDIGDSLVKADSARGGARDTNTASCSYAVDLTVGGSLVAHFTGLKDAPSVADFGASGCFHPNLTADIGLAGEVLSDVSDVLRLLHAHFDPLSMEVPAMCEQGGGRMKNGIFPPGSEPGAVTTTPQDWVYTDSQYGFSDGTKDQKVKLSKTQAPTAGNGHVAAATAVGCFAGGTAIWPDSLVFSSGDGSLLGSFDLSTVTDGAHAYIRQIDLHGPTAKVTWVGSGPLSQGLPDNYLQSTATFTYAGAKALVMSNRTDSGIALGGIIDFGRIGALTDAMTLEQLKTKLFSTAQADTGNPACAAITFGTNGADEHDRILGLVSALAQSRGADGPADMLMIGTSDPTTSLSAYRAEIRLLPRTTKGIGLGSTKAQLRAAYPAAKASTGLGGTELEIQDGSGSSIRFFVNASNVVYQIATGRTKYLSTADWCG